MLTVQEFPSALSVPTTLAARPLSARSLLRTLRLALRDGGGRAGTGSGTPSITFAFAPASRCASISFINSIPRSICSSVIAFTPPLWSSALFPGTSQNNNLRHNGGLRAHHLVDCLATALPKGGVHVVYLAYLRSMTAKAIFEQYASHF